MNKYFAVFLAMGILTTSMAFAQAGITYHAVHIQNVFNFARDIDLRDDTGIILPEWLDVMKKQPIVSGNAKPSYAMMKKINDDANKKPYAVNKGWPTPNEFKKAATADCKGYAITKYYEMRKAGWKPEDLNLWIGDFKFGETLVPHVVLVANINGKQYVMDIGDTANLPEAKDYFYKYFLPAYRFNEIGWDVR